jgi:hypothetical protein
MDVSESGEKHESVKDILIKDLLCFPPFSKEPMKGCTWKDPSTHKESERKKRKDLHYREDSIECLELGEDGGRNEVGL